MPQRRLRIRPGPGAAGQALVVALGQRGGFGRGPGQQLEEALEALEVGRHAFGELPEDGASFSASRSTPEAKKLASAVSTSLSFFMWAMKRLPFTAKTKPGGVSSYQRR